MGHRQVTCDVFGGGGEEGVVLPVKDDKGVVDSGVG